MKPTRPAKYASYLPSGFPRLAIETFCFAIVDLQGKRHRTDYDPMIRLGVADARMAIRTARRALVLFRVAPQHRSIFLMLLLFTPR